LISWAATTPLISAPGNQIGEIPQLRVLDSGPGRDARLLAAEACLHWRPHAGNPLLARVGRTSGRARLGNSLSATEET